MPKTATKRSLQAHHHVAIEMRYVGKTYSQIAEDLTAQFKRDFRADVVARWFRSNGILELEYLDYARKENDRRRQFVVEELKKVIPKIPLKFEQLLDRTYMIPIKKTGEVVNTNIPQLDIVTVSTLKTLCEILGFKIQDAPL